MKKLFLIVCISLSISSFSQPYYFLQDNATYTPLPGSATSINNGAVWSGFQTFPVPIGFTFDYMDASFTSVDFEASGRLIFDVNHFYFADMLVAQGLQDKGTSTSMSPLSYELTGNPGNQILKIEIRNAEYAGDAGSSIDFQIWLYEYTSRLELHMGPITINNSSNAFGNGPYSGLYHVTTWAPTNYGYGLNMMNDPLNPDDTTYMGTGITTTNLSLNNAPQEGQVYIYTDDTSFLSVENVLLNEITVYPNPADVQITLNGLPSNGKIFIHSLTGQKVLEANTAGTIIQLNTSQLSGGLYVVSVLNSENVLSFRKRIVID